MSETKQAEWQALADRCSAATGPDREIDCLIYCASGHNEYERPFMARSKMDRELPALTASLDAIVALIERELPDWRWLRKSLVAMTLFQWSDDLKNWSNHIGAGATPALALCAAFCKAMSQRSVPK